MSDERLDGTADYIDRAKDLLLNVRRELFENEGGSLKWIAVASAYDWLKRASGEVAAAQNGGIA